MVPTTTQKAKLRSCPSTIAVRVDFPGHVGMAELALVVVGFQVLELRGQHPVGSCPNMPPPRLGVRASSVVGESHAVEVELSAASVMLP
jgi:hypothetical protein